MFRPEKVLKGVGVITGLAWTSMGGATLPIEANRVHSLNRGFKITGQLGEVMRESAEIAYSYVCAHLKQYKADPKFFDEAFVHMHVPEGATPKDGPSAGITMTSALLSLARNQAPRTGVAMTGEITLTGQVLPVGGIREKVIAARRQSIFELILPKPTGETTRNCRPISGRHDPALCSRYEDVARVRSIERRGRQCRPSLFRYRLPGNLRPAATADNVLSAAQCGRHRHPAPARPAPCSAKRPLTQFCQYPACAAAAPDVRVHRQSPAPALSGIGKAPIGQIQIDPGQDPLPDCPGR